MDLSINLHRSREDENFELRLHDVPQKFYDSVELPEKSSRGTKWKVLRTGGLEIIIFARKYAK